MGCLNVFVCFSRDLLCRGVWSIVCGVLCVCVLVVCVCVFCVIGCAMLSNVLLSGCLCLCVL